MIITFCGHGDFIKTEKIENTLIELLKFFAKGRETIDCYCGGNGRFDGFAAECVRKAKKDFENIRNCLIIPYLSLSFQEKIKYLNDYYDEIIYPPLKNIPAKYAIIKRNEWMVDKADLLIAYVKHSWAAQRKLWNTQKERILLFFSYKKCPRRFTASGLLAYLFI